MILSHSKKFFFFCNPKSGSTSIESVLSQYRDSEQEDIGSPGLFPRRHVPPAYVRAMVSSDVWRSYFKFVVVRNPVDWVVSQYRWNFPPPMVYLKKLWWVPRRTVDTVKEYATYRRQIHRRRLDASDIKFLFGFLRRYRGLPSNATLFQSAYVLDADGSQIVDYVGRLESLDRCVLEIGSRLGIDLRVPHLNVSFRRSCLESLTDCAIESIYDLWSEDFDALGYEKIDPAALRDRCVQPESVGG